MPEDIDQLTTTIRRLKGQLEAVEATGILAEAFDALYMECDHALATIELLQDEH